MQEFIKGKPRTGRNSSYEKTLEILLETFGKNPIVMIETGSIRSNSETSRFGDGWGTLNLKYYADYTDSKLWSVDIDQNVISIASNVVPSDHRLSYVCSDSIKFLKEFPKEIDFLLLDSYDYCGDEENIRKAHEHCLNEVKAAFPKLSENAIILVDDVFDQVFNGKGKQAIPYLLNNGFELIHCFDSQALLKRKVVNKNLPSVSCVMTTYGRTTCVENSIKMFIDQDYEGVKELIIYNTDVEYPFTLGESLQPFAQIIKIINNNTDKVTGLPYTNVGAIRRDALDEASYELYICWDDDDIFLPFNIRQCVNGLLKSGKRAWKPKHSFFWGAGEPEYAENVMEASVIVYTEEIRKRGFRQETGSEHCGWYQEVVDEGKFFTDSNSIPSYCFNWSRSTGPSDHKQSGDINNVNNFQNHKERSTDHATKPLELPDQVKLDRVYERLYKVLRSKKSLSNDFQKQLIDENVPKELVFVSAQPDDLYFAWQIEIQIHNFRQYNYSDKMHVVVYYAGQKQRNFWNKLVATYPEVKFFFYKDQGAKINPYIPVLRPHILKQFFKENPDLKDKAVFYHDSDICLTGNIDFLRLCKGNTWYLSDTVSYIGANYLKSKGEYIFKEMCRIVGIDEQLVIDNERNSGGAQYLMKNIDYTFWEKVENDCLALYKYMCECNEKDLFHRQPRTDIQAWCADMWAVLWNGLLRGNEVRLDKDLNFSWATSMQQEFQNCKIFHLAGATADRPDLFFKGNYINSLPYGKVDFNKISDKYGSHFYAKLVEEVGKVSCLI